MSPDITTLLNAVRHGDRPATEQLFRAVEDQLRAIAARRRARFDPGMDAPVTLLVDEVFLRMLRPGEELSPADRREFFRFAAIKIQDLLIEVSRREGARKRGGDRNRVEALSPEDVAGRLPEQEGLLADLRDALDRFEQFAPEEALLFRVRYFLGCTIEEAAEVLGLSVDQANRKFRRTKQWLQQELGDYADDA